MNQRSKIFQELAETPVLAGAASHMPFSVPEGYFEQLPLQLLKRCSLEKQCATFAGLQAVPAGYFENLPQQLLSIIKQSQPQEVQQELEQIAPALLNINRTPPYHLPSNYFEELAPIPAVLPGRKNEARPLAAAKAGWWQVAAAVLVVLASLGIWQMSQPTLQINTPTPAIVSAAATDSDIDTVLLSRAFAQLDDEALLYSLTDAGVTSETRTALYYYNTHNFEDALQSFSADDLVQHLKEIPNPQPGNPQMN